MLIFMIFVMLATERKAEMGMARAVGAQRSSLTQAFISEGMAYSLLAGAVGALFGVVAALGLVVGFLKISGGFDFIEPHITVRSLVVSYCLGVVVTFITVAISAAKVSSVNIVAAIRDIDAEPEPAKKRQVSLAGARRRPADAHRPAAWPLGHPAQGPRHQLDLDPRPRRHRPRPLRHHGGQAAAARCRSSSSPSASRSCRSASPRLPRSYKAPARLTWTLVGVYLAAYWLAPVNYGKLILGVELQGDIEMFLLSGIMVVIASTLIIMHNAQLLTAFFQRGSGPRYGLTAGPRRR